MQHSHLVRATGIQPHDILGVGLKGAAVDNLQDGAAGQTEFFHPGVFRVRCHVAGGAVNVDLQFRVSRGTDRESGGLLPRVVVVADVVLGVALPSELEDEAVKVVVGADADVGRAQFAV